MVAPGALIKRLGLKTRWDLRQLATRANVFPTKDDRGWSWYTEDQILVLERALQNSMEAREAQEAASVAQQPRRGRPPTKSSLAAVSATPTASTSSKIMLPVEELEDPDHARRAFAFFLEGKSPAAAVVELGLPTGVVLFLWQRWIQINEWTVLTKKDMATLTSLPWVRDWDGKDGRGLVQAAVAQFAFERSQQRCASCNKLPKKHCDECLKKKVKAVEDAYLGGGKR